MSYEIGIRMAHVNKISNFQELIILDICGLHWVSFISTILYLNESAKKL